MSGSQIRLNDDYDEQLSQARQKLSKELDKQDAELEKFYEANDSKKEADGGKSPAENLPPELRAKFAEMLKREDD